MKQIFLKEDTETLAADFVEFLVADEAEDWVSDGEIRLGIITMILLLVFRMKRCLKTKPMV
jgi:hypothetical protein